MSPSQVDKGDVLTLTCFITCHSQLKVTMTLTEASRTIETNSMSIVEGHNFTVIATVLAERPQLGPFQCLTFFTQPDNSISELAGNSIQLQSTEIPVLQLARTFWTFSFSLYTVSQKKVSRNVFIVSSIKLSEF